MKVRIQLYVKVEDETEAKIIFLEVCQNLRGKLTGAAYQILEDETPETKH